MRIYSVNIHKIILHIYAFRWNIFVWLFTIHLALCYSFHRSPRTPKVRQAHFGEPQGAVPLTDHYRVVNRRLRHSLLNLVRTPSTAMRSPFPGGEGLFFLHSPQGGGLLTFHFQLSTFNSSLFTIHYSLSTIHYPLSTIHS